MINNVVLVGRLTKDPDLKYTASGNATATFSLAVNRNFTNQSGEREADFINCVIWQKPAETLVNYASKGTLLGITGRIKTRNYENQQGQRVYVTEVVVGSFQLLEKKSSESQSNYNAQEQHSNDFQGNNHANNRANSNPFEGSDLDISDDDLPF